MVDEIIIGTLFKKVPKITTITNVNKIYLQTNKMRLFFYSEKKQGGEINKKAGISPTFRVAVPGIEPGFQE